jgi:hypothetical protein
MADLYSEFLEAVRLIVKTLELKNVKIKNTKYETPEVGIDYICDAFSESIRFNFHLRTKSKETDYTNWTVLSLHLYFYNDYEVCQLDRHKKFRHPEKVDINQWASEVAKEYLNKKNSNELNFLFGDRDIRVRGVAGATNTTLIEFIINLKGYLDWGADRLLVYRFHHGSGRSEGFSYAFLIESRYLVYDYSFWCVFPAFAGMSGGTSYGGYKQVESLLEDTKKKIKEKILDIQVPEDEFLKFLREKNVSFMNLQEEYETLKKRFGAFAREAEEPVFKGPSRIGKYSLSKIPGKRENRVFIGGNYDNITVLREIKSIVSNLGHQPILALEFDGPIEKVHDNDLLLLHNCKYSIFEITIPDGHLMELERANEYGVETLMVFQARDEKRKPPASISSMVLSLDLPKYGYLNFADLKKRISKFLAQPSAKAR